MNNNIGLISIIMAAYNAEKTIAMAIDSVVTQSYENWELIIVNDCSADNTLNIAKSYSDKDIRVNVITNEKNSGVSASRLKALESAHGEWIAILDSDDAWLPEKLQRQVEMQAKTNADIVFTASSFMKNDGTPLKYVMPVPESVTYKKLLKQNIISNSSAMVRRNLYSKYYVNNDSIHEDFAMWLQILKNGYTAVGVNEPLLIYRLSENSKSSNKIKSAIMNWRTYRYVGICFFCALFHMIVYSVRNILKYRRLR